jgi:hypothetical protein
MIPPMQQEQNKTWFRAKTYGWGWGLPVRWQGWVMLGLYLVLLPIGAANIGPNWRIPYVAVLTAVLIFICWLKGEKPSWRWGGK